MKDLFPSNWLHGDVRYYDVSDPTNPQLKSQAWLSGLLDRRGARVKARGPNGGRQIIQNSLDGNRVYVTKSLFIEMGQPVLSQDRGMAGEARAPAGETYQLDPDFFVDFHEHGDGARPHEIHLPGGACTTEIFQ